MTIHTVERNDPGAIAAIRRNRLRLWPPAVSAGWHDLSMRPPFDLEALAGDWWEVHGTEQAAELQRELARELPREHVLGGVPVEAVAVKRNLKDVAFWLPQSAEWAHVHLSYKVETDARWPWTVVVMTWTDLVYELT